MPDLNLIKQAEQGVAPRFRQLSFAELFAWSLAQPGAN